MIKTSIPNETPKKPFDAPQISVVNLACETILLLSMGSELGEPQEDI